MQNSKLEDLLEALRTSGYAAMYQRGVELVEAGDLAHEELEDWVLVACEQADRFDAKDFEARGILRGEGTDHQKLQAIQRLMGWNRPSKREPRELLNNYRALTTQQGQFVMMIRSGPRAGTRETIEGCPSRTRRRSNGSGEPTTPRATTRFSRPYMPGAAGPTVQQRRPLSRRAAERVAPTF